MPHTVNIRLLGSTVRATNAVGTRSYTEQFGQGNAPAGNVSLANGTGNGAANVTYVGGDSGNFSIAGGGNLTVDLKGGNGERDALNNALNLATVKLVYLELDAASLGNVVRVGPNGNALCANLGFNAAGYTSGDVILLTAQHAGWPVGSNANLVVYNPGNATVTGKLRVTGVGA